MPPEPQMPVQQSLGPLHDLPTMPQAHLPVLTSQVALQQSPPSKHSPPTGLQPHLPFSQRSRQQSPSLLQLVPAGLQSHWPKKLEVQRPLQHSLPSMQLPPGGPQQTPSAHTLGLAQLLDVQVLPSMTQVVPIFL
jgi:hypothetical protein